MWRQFILLPPLAILYFIGQTERFNLAADFGGDVFNRLVVKNLLDLCCFRKFHGILESEVVPYRG
jgi:hypothetical protein